jgi:hypothetical protein
MSLTSLGQGHAGVGYARPIPGGRFRSLSECDAGGSVVVAVLAVLHVFSLEGTHVTRTAMRAIVVTSGTPYVYPFA